MIFIKRGIVFMICFGLAFIVYNQLDSAKSLNRLTSRLMFIVSQSEPKTGLELQQYKLNLRKLFNEHFDMQRDFYRYKCNNRVRIGHNERARVHNLDDLYRIDGAWFVCMDDGFRLELNSCNILSFGINTDYQFDQEANQKYGCTVHSFDPFVEDRMFARKRIEQFGSQAQPRTVQVNEKWKFHRMGITAKANEKNSSFPAMLSLPSILEYVGLKDQIIDVFKMDIEGGEEKVFKDWDAEYMCKYVKQFVIETHPGSQLIPELMRKKMDTCFSLFHRDHRFFDLSMKSNPLGFMTEWQYPKSAPYKLDIGKFKSELDLAEHLYTMGELYFVNENFLEIRIK